MPLPFSRSLRALDTDHFGGLGLRIVVVAALLAGWVAWALVADVGVYAQSASARLEVGELAHPVEPVVSGRVEHNHMELGREVAAGDVLVELDATQSRLELLQSSALLASIGPQVAARRRELDAQRSASSAEGRRGPLAMAEANARVDEAQAAARQAKDNLERIQKLYSAKLVAQSDLVRAQGDLDRAATAADALRYAAGRTATERRSSVDDRRIQVSETEREIAALEGQMLATSANIQRLEHEIALHVVRSPVAGRLAELKPEPPGTLVQAGEQIAAIVPGGEVRLVADFAPADALGRVRAGQRARFRLDGFPWTQYGAVPARVERVANELRNGFVRVELSIERDGASRAPVEHGLPGTVEVEVERVSPAVLVLRSAGALIAGPSASVAARAP
jgi:membrane fusion protein (multidrug efflux system)